ncbi:MAG TPA: cytochrome c [Nevskiaceae bacterium]
MRRITRRAQYCAFALAGLVAAGAAAAAGNPTQGRIDAYTCMGCHGIPGYTNAYPNYRVPKLGGQSPQYIVSALKEYREGDRSHPTMRIQANALSDQQMEDIAAFLSQSPERSDDLRN